MELLEEFGMIQKSVLDLIFDKFAESIEKDDLFGEISGDLIALVRERKSKAMIEKLLRKKQDENPKSGS